MVECCLLFILEEAADSLGWMKSRLLFNDEKEKRSRMLWSRREGALLTRPKKSGEREREFPWKQISVFNFMVLYQVSYEFCSCQISGYRLSFKNMRGNFLYIDKYLMVECLYCRIHSASSYLPVSTVIDGFWKSFAYQYPSLLWRTWKDLFEDREAGKWITGLCASRCLMDTEITRQELELKLMAYLWDLWRVERGTVCWIVWRISHKTCTRCS